MIEGVLMGGGKMRGCVDGRMRGCVDGRMRGCANRWW